MAKENNRPKVILPCFGENCITTIEKEIKFFQSLTAMRMYDYGNAKTGNNLSESVMQILLHHAKRSVKISAEEYKKLFSQVEAFIEKDKPILITVSLSLGGRVQNKLKFFDSTNLPSFAWLHLAYYFKMINEKIKTIYTPGIKIVLVDEATLFFDILGIAEYTVRQNLVAAKILFEAIKAPIEIKAMEKKVFPLEVEPEEVSDSQTFAMLWMLPLMTDEQIMTALYTHRVRDYDQIRNYVGEQMWQKAQRFSSMVNAMLAWRKKINLFERWGYRGAIDACIVEKPNRLVFKPTSKTFFNHGMPVIKRGNQGNYKIFIVPESRIAQEFPNASPVIINPKEAFSIDEPEYTFYYEVLQ